MPSTLHVLQGAAGGSASLRSAADPRCCDSGTVTTGSSNAFSQMEGCLSHTHAHSQPGVPFLFYGPVAQRHLWAQLPSCFHHLDQEPVPLGKVANEVRACDRSSLNLSADLALLSLWHSHGDRKTPSWQPGGHREGRHVLPHRCSQHWPSQRREAPAGANTKLLFSSDNGRKTASTWESVIESKCESLAGNRPPTTTHVHRCAASHVTPCC